MVGAEVVDVEDEFFGKVFRRAPDDPTYAGVDKSVSVVQVVSFVREEVKIGKRDVLVARGVNGNDFLKAEIPLQLWNDEGSYESTRRSIDVDNSINVLLDQQIVDRLRIFVFARVCRAQDNTNTNRILVNHGNRLLGVNHVSLRRAENVFLLNLKVSSCLLPAYLHGRAHDDIGLVSGLAGCNAGVLPALLHGEDSEHDGFRGSDSRGADCGGIVTGGGGIEEAADHRHAAVLDVGGLGVFFVVDEVLGEGLGHEVLDFFFL